ncbi:MAG TPA: Rrf2 family transcriptional regulator [Candidatus Sumerlaeota bacterium]|nr:Rrf2 family transcriptional regulator [Candidatus Sumerlaeota bacterium]HNM46227.1 Rrf2 family transcriptional regulator [Candidatus Sumerlaeota bacterium]
MHLTMFTDFGLRTLMFVAANPGRLCSVKEISGAYGISRNHLVKVVHRLGQLNYVETVKGRGGGIRLARPAEEMRLGDLIQTLEANMILVECFDSATNTCLITNTCQLKHYLHDAKQAFLSSLNEHTLADTVKNRELLSR